MTIPARDVRRAFAEHSLRFHNKILENFVERSAHVYIAVGEWRAIMQNEQFSALSRFLNLLVKARLLPCAEDFRLPRGVVRLHRKFRARQVQCVFVILSHGERSTVTSVNPRSNAVTGRIDAARSPISPT